MADTPFIDKYVQLLQQYSNPNIKAWRTPTGEVYYGDKPREQGASVPNVSTQPAVPPSNTPAPTDTPAPVGSQPGTAGKQPGDLLPGDTSESPAGQAATAFAEESFDPNPTYGKLVSFLASPLSLIAAQAMKKETPIERAFKALGIDSTATNTTGLGNPAAAAAAIDAAISNPTSANTQEALGHLGIDPGSTPSSTGATGSAASGTASQSAVDAAVGGAGPAADSGTAGPSGTSGQAGPGPAAATGPGGMAEGSGGGGGDAGGTVICTELRKQEIMSMDLWEADDAFGNLMKETDPDVYYGYVRWARYVAVAMQRSKIITWAVAALALPWAEQMAYIMHRRQKGNMFGAFVMAVGKPICKQLGKKCRK